LASIHCQDLMANEFGFIAKFIVLL